jgi:hypothetical protein
MVLKTRNSAVAIVVVSALLSLTACGPSAQDVRDSTLRSCWDFQYAIVNFNKYLEVREETFEIYNRQAEIDPTFDAEAVNQEFTYSFLELIYDQGSDGRPLLAGSTEEFKTSLAEYLNQVKDDETVFNANLQRVLDECLAVGLDIETESSDTDSFRFMND